MTYLPDGQWDYRPAVDDLVRIHDGLPPLHPHRALPPRPLPRHLCDPAPRRPSDLPAVRRIARARQALARITRRTAA